VKVNRIIVVAALAGWSLSSPSSGMADATQRLHAVHNDLWSTQAMTAQGEGALREMRASIIGQEGDEFIAQTQDGDKFRLPVEGAPDDVAVGDALILVPDEDTQTIHVFKADATEEGDAKPEVQL
jgi:hypothetical protein